MLGLDDTDSQSLRTQTVQGMTMLENANFEGSSKCSTY